MQRGIAHIFLILGLLLAIGLGIYLVQTRTNILPHAQDAPEILPQQASFGLLVQPNANAVSGGITGGKISEYYRFFPGDEIRVDVKVSSDIEAANTFSAVINYPKELLEATSIIKNRGEVWDENGEIQDEPRVCAQVITRACKPGPGGGIYNENGSEAYPAELCETFATPCDVPPGWIVQGDSKPLPISTCLPRPACLDANPACQMPEDPNWCPPSREIPPAPTCKPRPVCIPTDTSPCPLESASDNQMCTPGVEAGDYFIQFWLPDTKFEDVNDASSAYNDSGRVVLSGGVSNPGLKTTPGEMQVMATILFKAKKPGEAKLNFSDESLILRNSDAVNILTGKNGTSITIEDKSAVKGDLDGDGVVGFRDFSILLSKWGSDDPKADLNKDGKVNIFDFSVLLSNWTGFRKSKS